MSELQHYGVKGMKWGVRKSEYKSMSRSQKKQVRKKYEQDKIDSKAEKRVGKHGLDKANAISIGRGALSTVLRGSAGLTGMKAAASLVTTSNALGMMASVYSGSTAAGLAATATLTGVSAIPMAALGAYGMYSAGKRIYRASRDVSANTRAQAKRQ